MPLTITKLSVDELSKEFKRPSNNEANITEYIDTLKGMSVGDGFNMKVDQGLVIDSTDKDGNADTVRTFKRRVNSAATLLGFTLKWKTKGHTRTDGEFEIDWIIVKITAKKDS